jgi:hypothetical protein
MVALAYPTGAWEQFNIGDDEEHLPQIKVSSDNLDFRTQDDLQTPSSFTL